MIKRANTMRTAGAAATAAAFCLTAIAGAAAQTSAALASISAPATGSSTQLIGNTVHLVVGRSMFINTTNRLRRVYVSNPAVLDSITSTPNQIVITAKEAGTSSLVLWDETGRSESYQVICDLDVSSLSRALRQAFPGEDIHASGSEGGVELAGDVSNPAVEDAALKLAGLYSKTVANSLLVSTQHVPQVRLKIRVVEIDRSRAQQMGFNLFTAGKNTSAVATGQFPAVSVEQSTATTTSNSASSVSSNSSGLLSLTNLLNLFYYNNSLGIGAAIQALENKQILQILAEPNLTTLSGQSASFLSGGQFPFPVVQGGTGGFTSVTVEFRPYGVQLNFTPVVLPDGTIQMKIATEVSALDYTNAVQISGYTIPALSTRRAKTEIELKSGQSFAISGLLDNRTTDLLQKIPGIGDVPILGKLFQSTSKTHSVQELAVIATPTLVNPLAENPAPPQPKMVVPFINDRKFDKGMVPKKQSQGANQQ